MLYGLVGMDIWLFFCLPNDFKVFLTFVILYGGMEESGECDLILGHLFLTY